MAGTMGPAFRQAPKFRGCSLRGHGWRSSWWKEPSPPDCVAEAACGGLGATAVVLLTAAAVAAAVAAGRAHDPAAFRSDRHFSATERHGCCGAFSSGVDKLACLLEGAGAGVVADFRLDRRCGDPARSMEGRIPPGQDPLLPCYVAEPLRRHPDWAARGGARWPQQA